MAFTKVRVLGLNNAVQKLEELEERMRTEEFGFKDNDIKNIDLIIDALYQLERARVDAHEELERETVRTSILRFHVTTLPGRINDEIREAVQQARDQNIREMRALKARMIEFKIMVEDLTSEAEEIEADTKRRQVPARDRLQKQYDEIIRSLNVTMNNRQVASINLNELREAIRSDNTVIVDTEDSILNIKELLIEDRVKAAKIKRDLKQQIKDLEPKVKKQHADNSAMRRRIIEGIEEIKQGKLRIREAKRALEKRNKDLEAGDEDFQQEEALAQEVLFRNSLLYLEYKTSQQAIEEEEEEFMTEEKSYQARFKEGKSDYQDDMTTRRAQNQLKKDLKDTLKQKVEEGVERKKQIEDLNKSLDITWYKMKKKMQDVARIKEENKELFRSKTIVKASHKSKVVYLAHVIEENEEELVQEKVRFEAEEEVLKETEHKMEEVKEDTTQLMEVMDAVTTQNEKEFKKLDDQVIDLGVQLREEEKEITTIEDVVKSKKEELKEQKVAQTQQLTSMKNEIEFFGAKINNFHMDISMLKDRIADAKMAVDDFEMPEDSDSDSEEARARKRLKAKARAKARAKAKAEAEGREWNSDNEDYWNSDDDDDDGSDDDDDDGSDGGADGAGGTDGAGGKGKRKKKKRKKKKRKGKGKGKGGASSSDSYDSDDMNKQMRKLASAIDGLDDTLGMSAAEKAKMRNWISTGTDFMDALKDTLLTKEQKAELKVIEIKFEETLEVVSEKKPVFDLLVEDFDYRIKKNMDLTKWNKEMAEKREELEWTVNKIKGEVGAMTTLQASGMTIKDELKFDIKSRRREMLTRIETHYKNLHVVEIDILDSGCRLRMVVEHNSRLAEAIANLEDHLVKLRAEIDNITTQNVLLAQATQECHDEMAYNKAKQECIEEKIVTRDLETADMYSVVIYGLEWRADICTRVIGGLNHNLRKCAEFMERLTRRTRAMRVEEKASPTMLKVVKADVMLDTGKFLCDPWNKDRPPSKLKLGAKRVLSPIRKGRVTFPSKTSGTLLSQTSSPPPNQFHFPSLTDEEEKPPRMRHSVSFDTDREQTETPEIDHIVPPDLYQIGPPDKDQHRPSVRFHKYAVELTHAKAKRVRPPWVPLRTSKGPSWFPEPWNWRKELKERRVKSAMASVPCKISPCLLAPRQTISEISNPGPSSISGQGLRSGFRTPGTLRFKRDLNFVDHIAYIP